MPEAELPEVGTEVRLMSRERLGEMSSYRTTELAKVEFGANPRRALVITTVVHESRAVNAHLVDIERIAGARGTIYEMGRFPEPSGDWHVIHVITQAGNCDASAVATKAHAEFGSFNVQMFVGVAGSLKEDIPIGSVVVGEYVYNSHSGKQDDKGHYSRPHSHAAASELLKAAQMLVLDGDWIDFIKDPMRTKLPAIDSYPCPFPPEAVIKSIASGELVIAGGNTPFYQTIRQYLNDAGAVEMEGWGAMNAAHQEGTSAIVIRGISDMCDGKDHQSDARNQPVASAHAAAFAFAMLSIRSKASPLSSSGAGPPMPPDETPTLGPASDDRIDFVVNFKGSPSDWSSDQLERVVVGLRKVTGDPDLTLVRVDEGSIRLVLSVRKKDVEALTLDAVRTAAGDEREKLLGAGTAQELAKAEEATAALKLASAGLLSWEQKLPDGGWLERPEKREIERRFHSEFSSTVVLGEPGSGKSALLAAIATDLIESHSPVLAIKADFVATGVHRESDLQTDLGLPALPSELILCLARLQPVFLLIDQLDALASQLDLHSDRLNVLLNLVRRVAGLQNVHVVLAARTFEFNHDVRLKSVEAEAVTLMLPAWHEVREKLVAAGIDADTWPDNAREVVRSPQALKTYLSLSKTSDDQPFSKYQSMLEQLWRQKIATARHGEALASMASELAGTMAEEETLWLAVSRFDSRTLVLDQLESEGIVVRSKNGKSVGFSHQTVFDYVLARSFVLATGRLSSYVLERQNSLFVRAKLWSALRYLRDAEIASYEREFLTIWQQEGLRRHLRLLLIEFLGEHRDPVAFEKICLDHVMQSSDLRLVGLKSIIGSPGWFTNFQRSAIPAAMAGVDTEANQALNILRKAWSFAADDVVRLLREQWLPSPERDNFLWAALDACTTWTEKVEQIASVVLSRTPISTWQVDYAAAVIAVAQPEVAFRLVREKLNFLLGKVRAAQSQRPLRGDGTSDEKSDQVIINQPTKAIAEILGSIEWNSLPDIAEAEPQKFIQGLWPWFRAVFHELKDRLQEEAPDYAFPRHYSVDIDVGGDSSENMTREQPVLTSLRLAVEGTATKDEHFFSKWAQENGDLEFMESQRLIAYGFSVNPKAFAQQAYKWLFDDPRRLQLGNSYGHRQTTAALIGAVSPYWTEGQVREFEAKVQEYRPTMPAHITEPEQRRFFDQFVRTTRAHLLNAVPTNQLSVKAKTLISTEKRALGEDLDPGIRLSGGGFIGSPMEATAMAKARDRDILKIFKEVPDNTDWTHPTGWMRGGNIQLSRAFAAFAKTEPRRALRIMEQFDPSAQERAAGYAIDSMAEIGGHDRELQEAMMDLHARGFGLGHFRDSIARAVEKIAQRPESIDERVIEMLIGWLSASRTGDDVSGEEDVSETIEKEGQENTSEARRESILWGHGGISILPGGNFLILSALTSILLKGTEEGRDRLLTILNDHLLRERNPKVWQALFIRLSHAGGSTPEIVSKFIRALFARHPSLLESREAIHFLAYAQGWDVALVHELIAAWGCSDNAMLRQAQGELVGLISTVHNSSHWAAMLAELFERGSAEAKIGLAHAGAHLWVEPQFHATAGKLLQQLIHGAEATRMSAILDVFRICNELVPDPTTLSFLSALTAPEVKLSSAPSMFVVEKLQSLLPHAADVIGEIAMKLVDEWRTDLGDVGAANSIVAPQLTDLAITLHRLGGASRTAGVTIFEALIDLDVYGAKDTLAEIDGRFGIHQTGSRRRIARRAAKRAPRRSN